MTVKSRAIGRREWRLIDGASLICQAGASGVYWVIWFEALHAPVLIDRHEVRRLL